MSNDLEIVKVEIYDCELGQLDRMAEEYNPIFCRIHTRSGLTGIGEAGLAYGYSKKAAVGQLLDFAPRVIGLDARQTEYIWESFFRGTFWGMGGGPVVYSGISAIDTALWDIKGKHYGVPIHELLGGKTNDNLRTYASQLQYDWGPDITHMAHPIEYARAARKAIDEGYDCVKLDPIAMAPDGSKPHIPTQSMFGLLSQNQIQTGYDRLKAVREEIGPENDIILEVHALLGVNSAIQFGRACKDLNILYYEEPTHPLHSDNFAKIAQKVDIPIATGERSYTRWGFRELIEKKAVAVIQPDICLAGGITETKKICDYANLYDATVQIHVCGGPISLAASLQVEAAIPNFIIHEHHKCYLVDAVTSLCKHNYQPVNGRFKVPCRPGLGQELNDSVVRSFLAHVIE